MITDHLSSDQQVALKLDSIALPDDCPLVHTLRTRLAAGCPTLARTPLITLLALQPLSTVCRENTTPHRGFTPHHYQTCVPTNTDTSLLLYDTLPVAKHCFAINVLDVAPHSIRAGCNHLVWRCAVMQCRPLCHRVGA